MRHTLHRTLVHRPWAVWLAVLIAVFAALAPAVSQAFALAQGATPMAMDICTSGDTPPLLADSPAGPSIVKSLEHCPVCLHSADRVAVLPVVALPPLLVPDASPPPRVQQVFFFSTYLAHAPPPRGPPGFQNYQSSSA